MCRRCGKRAVHHTSRGLCKSCYVTLMRRGELEPLPRPSVLERFAMRVALTDDGHWLWIGTCDHAGYGRFMPAGKNWPAHRWAYEHFVGSIPEGLHLDHLCRVRNCVNPEHLEPVTPRENNLRSNSAGAVARRTNRCKYGHDLTDAYVNPHTGWRYCLPCKRRRCRESLRKTRAARRAA